jgi:serine/threonine protein phosphatase PrpC
MPFEFHALTDTGRARNNNEDAVAIDPDAGLAVLADGMGGYNAGEVASEMACEFVRRELGLWLQDCASEATDTEVCRAMDICVENANTVVFQAAHSDVRYAGMGTTIVVAVFREHRLLVGHVGDSRAYRLREGQLTQITRDHSLLQEQIDAGLITAEQAALSIHKNLVTRAVGVEDTVLMDTSPFDVQPGDIYLLCSDGLSDMLEDSRISSHLKAGGELKSIAQALVDDANVAGGRDNISVVLIRASGAPAQPPGRTWWPFRR